MAELELRNKRLECIKRLLFLNNSYYEITDWLVANKLVTKENVIQCTRDQERAELILTSLKNGEQSEKLMLVTFEWQILPTEYIKIYIVTEQEQVSFIYGL